MTPEQAKRVRILVDHGTAKIGTVFVRGLHGIPSWPHYVHTKPDDWFWEEGTTKEDNGFLPASCFTELTKDNWEPI